MRSRFVQLLLLRFGYFSMGSKLTNGSCFVQHRLLVFHTWLFFRQSETASEREEQGYCDGYKGARESHTEDLWRREEANAASSAWPPGPANTSAFPWMPGVPFRCSPDMTPAEALSTRDGLEGKEPGKQTTRFGGVGGLTIWSILGRDDVTLSIGSARPSEAIRRQSPADSQSSFH